MNFSCAWWRFDQEAKFILISFLANGDHASRLFQPLNSAVFIDLVLWKTAEIALLIPIIRLFTFYKVWVVDVHSINNSSISDWVCGNENTAPIFTCQVFKRMRSVIVSLANFVCVFTFFLKYFEDFLFDIHHVKRPYWLVFTRCSETLCCSLDSNNWLKMREYFKSFCLLQVVLIYLELDYFVIITMIFDEDNLFFVSSNLDCSYHLGRLTLDLKLPTI